MPKRNSKDKLKIIKKKVKKLENELKKIQSRRRQSRTLSASSASSTCSSRCGSIPENRNEQELAQAEVHVVEESAPAADPEPQDTESTENKYGSDINKEVANKFEHISTTGLNKKTRKELLNKYLVPVNCKNINAPELNPEIKAAANEQAIKRDKVIELKQKQISAGISCLGKIISDQLTLPEKNLELVKDLMDVGRILCDVQHTESTTRRNFALYSVKKEMKDQLTTTKIDKLLFGEDLPETLKVAKAVSKSSIDLKVDIPK